MTLLKIIPQFSRSWLLFVSSINYSFNVHSLSYFSIISYSYFFIDRACNYLFFIQSSLVSNSRFYLSQSCCERISSWILRRSMLALNCRLFAMPQHSCFADLDCSFARSTLSLNWEFTNLLPISRQSLTSCTFCVFYYSNDSYLYRILFISSILSSFLSMQLFSLNVLIFSSNACFRFFLQQFSIRRDLPCTSSSFLSIYFNF